MALLILVRLQRPTPCGPLILGVALGILCAPSALRREAALPRRGAWGTRASAAHYAADGKALLGRLSLGLCWTDKSAGAMLATVE